jgi:ribose-phosphate pyrophosphokinase
MILGGSTAQGLAAELAATTGEDLADVTFDRFPDGEGIVRVDDGAETTIEEAVVVAATTTDAAHVELLQLQDAAREAGARNVTTVLGYMGYVRQDRAFERGEPVSARAVARAISAGSDRVLVVEPHESAVCDFFDVPARAVGAGDRLAEPLPELSEPVFLSPDEGAVGLARTVRDAYGRGEVDHFRKTRHSGSEVSVDLGATVVADRDVVLVDDIVATGGTMSEAVGVLDGYDAARVYVACVHPLLAGSAYVRLVRAGVEAVYGTDTVERTVSAVSVAPAVAAALE